MTCSFHIPNFRLLKGLVIAEITKAWRISRKIRLYEKKKALGLPLKILQMVWNFYRMSFRHSGTNLGAERIKFQKSIFLDHPNIYIYTYRNFTPREQLTSCFCNLSNFLVRVLLRGGSWLSKTPRGNMFRSCLRSSSGHQ